MNILIEHPLLVSLAWFRFPSTPSFIERVSRLSYWAHDHRERRSRRVRLNARRFLLLVNSTCGAACCWHLWQQSALKTAILSQQLSESILWWWEAGKSEETGESEEASVSNADHPLPSRCVQEFRSFEHTMNFIVFEACNLFEFYEENFSKKCHAKRPLPLSFARRIPSKELPCPEPRLDSNKLNRIKFRQFATLYALQSIEAVSILKTQSNGTANS